MKLLKHSAGDGGIPPQLHTGHRWLAAPDHGRWKQSMRGRLKTLLVSIAVAAVVAMTADGTSYYFPKFGTPIVSSKQLVFSGPGWEPHRIICISWENGERRWEIQDSESILCPCFVMDRDLIITKGATVYSCDLSSGKTAPLYSTGYEKCWISPHQPPVVLISGERRNVEFLALVDIRRAKKRWEVAKLSHIIAKASGIFLCQYSEREVYSNGGFSRINQKLTAISAADGKVLWNYPQPKECWLAEGVAIGDHFVVDLAGTIHCLDQKTGAVVKTLQIQASPYASVSLVERGGTLLVWTQKGRDVFSGHVVYSLTVPELVKSQLAET
ncbi:MAG: PQQ-binding-like beta-propeller repeat protein, partial [Verrucomicrobia bacterium]|nr:PQQ-binding-like beta-propeller repeat protein [Verrucomicrobiota bacterium]